MRIYVVRSGDSPASIAARDEHAGCPKCCADLVQANPHKETVVHPNGFVSFKELRVGEELVLPEKWFDGRLDLLPPAYFASLPYHDGVTPSAFGEAAAGVLRDFRALDLACEKLYELEGMSEEAFANNMDSVADAIDAAVQPAAGSQYACDAQEALDWAVSGAATRTEVCDGLAAALGYAQHAIRELYATMQPPGHS
jgi:hypothetical protein